MRLRLPASRLSDGTHIELVRTLFTTLAPTTIMGLLFIVVSSMTVTRQPDALLGTLGVLGGATSILRVAITAGLERPVADPALDKAGALWIERVFAAAYLTFAVLLGAFAARALRVADAEMQPVVAALLVGYAAGVAAGIALRPWIAIPAVLLAVLPATATALASGDGAHMVLALVLASLLAGGIGSMVGRYRSEAEKVALRQAFASLARTDHLTGLANRLALDEAFGREVTDGTADRTAVHCLDLDGFKTVNDRLGHPAGDALLREVGERLRTLCRGRDLAARLGGDEFVLLQTGMRHAGEAELAARRIVRALDEPYLVAGSRVVVGVSVGYAPAYRGDDLYRLLSRADEALYRVKHAGGDAAAPAYREAAAIA